LLLDLYEPCIGYATLVWVSEKCNNNRHFYQRPRAIPHEKKCRTETTLG